MEEIHIPGKYHAKAKAYALLAKDAHSNGERRLMLRLEQSCLSFAKADDRTAREPLESKGN